MTPDEKRARDRERQRRLRQADPEGYRASQRKYVATRREWQRRHRASETTEQRALRLAKEKAKRAADPERYRAYWRKGEVKRAPRRRGAGGRSYSLHRRYGITVERYEELLLSQLGACAICRREPGKKPLCVDHWKGSKPAVVRGLLCDNCNLGVEWLKFDPEITLALATTYLEKAAKIDSGEIPSPVTRFYFSGINYYYPEALKSLPSACENCGAKDDLHIDHSKATSRIRGRLCRGCNCGLGHFKESRSLLMAARDYMLKHHALRNATTGP